MESTKGGKRRKKQSQYQQNIINKQFIRRAATVPINGHFKNRLVLKIVISTKELQAIILM